ncbi:hypothetical protein PFISCL1PPCAC_12107, partial [Pristionchus fissidentatus]
ILSNEKIRNGKKKLIADKYVSIRGRLYVVDEQCELSDPLSPMRIFDIDDGLKVKEVEVHYPVCHEPINMHNFTFNPTKNYADDVFFWAFDDGEVYDDFIPRENASYTEANLTESDGFHWSTVETTGEIPNEYAFFTVYDSQECHFYMNGTSYSTLHMLDLKTMIWKRIETIVNE